MATVLGLTMGLLAGFLGGAAYHIIMRFMDCLMSIPMIVLAISPGVAIMLAVFGFNVVGDGLRDALDPRLRGAI
jgi:ABC-type dipeptide/oligopeptide/nickel transport system permease subunit